jgi:hypothetical protein
MNKKQEKQAAQILSEYAKEIGVRKSHFSNVEKEKLKKKAKELWMNANFVR